MLACKRKVVKKEVSFWLNAKDMGPDIWGLIKLEHPSKYKRMQADLTTSDINNIRYGFAKGLNPVCVLVSY